MSREKDNASSEEISKRLIEREVSEAGYRSSEFKWFGNSHPIHATAKCFMCEAILTIDIENILTNGMPEVCPECKRRSLVFYDAKKWEDYLNLKLWQFDFFSDQFKTQYAAYNNGNNARHITPLKSEEMRGLLALRVKNKSALENSLLHLSGLCFRAGETKELQTRIAKKDNEIWVDMCDEKWRAIKITPGEGWKVEESPPILFRRYDHMRPLFSQEGDKKDLQDFLKLINFGGDDRDRQKLLYSGYLATQFLPEIQTALMMPVGPSGSAKSTMSILTRSIIDPSATKEIVLTQRTELPQTFMQHRLPVFGNCGYLSQEQSDMFCNLITGGSIFKRKLYTDGDAITWTFMHSTILNGIAPPSLAPDLMTRAIKFELEHIPESFLRGEQEVMKEANEILPSARGYLMQLVADTLAEPLPQSSEITRLGEFGRYGDVMTTKMGWLKGEFLEAIVKTGRENAKEAIEADYVGGVLLSILDEQNGWEGTSGELLTALKLSGLDEKNPNSPKTTARLSDMIYGKLKPGLGLFDWVVDKKRVMGKRIIVIKKKEEMKDMKASS